MSAELIASNAALHVAEWIGRASYAFGNEDELQAAIHQHLTRNAFVATREASLGAAGRIDLVVVTDATIGIEVKIDGSLSAVTTQLHSYAGSDTIEALVLVSTRLKHRGVPREINGKPVVFCYIGGQLL